MPRATHRKNETGTVRRLPACMVWASSDIKQARWKPADRAGFLRSLNATSLEKIDFLLSAVYNDDRRPVRLFVIAKHGI